MLIGVNPHAKTGMLHPALIIPNTYNAARNIKNVFPMFLHLITFMGRRIYIYICAGLARKNEKDEVPRLVQEKEINMSLAQFVFLR